MENSDYTQLEDYDIMDYPYPKKVAMTFMPSRLIRSPNKKIKITDECCLKSCAISEIRGYCKQ